MRRRSKVSSKPAKTRRPKVATLKRRNVRATRRSSTTENAKATHFARERDDALKQLSSASEVLGVISNSPGNLDLVFETILGNATRICEAAFGNLWLRVGDSFRIAATHGAPLAYREYLKGNPVVDPHTQSDAMARIVDTRKPLQVDDITKVPASGSTMRLATITLAKARTLVGVPMVKGNELVGVIAIYRQEVRPFTNRQIDLLTNFAVQAVIAIENARLLSELRESLQQQTATADVLKVISRSIFDLHVVLQTLVESAARLCDADKAFITREKDGAFYRAECYGFSQDFMDYIKDIPIEPDRGSAAGRALLEGRAVHIVDVRADAQYAWVEAQQKGDFRTIAAVPMLREGIPIGLLIMMRQQVRPFTDKQIELVSTFADQAAIAIENARLFEAEQQRTRELSESLEQQTATSEVLRVISSSPGNLNPVFQAMLENAVRICEAKFGNLFLVDGDGCRWAAGVETPPRLVEYFTERQSFQPTPGSHLDRVMRTKQVSHSADDTAEIVVGAAARLAGARSTVCVPMLKDNGLIGAIFIYRTEVRPFTDKQIALLQNFAAQAVIAIENARLLSELRKRTDDLTESLEQQTATSDVLRVISSSPGNLSAVFQAILENATHICAAKFGVLSLSEGDALRVVAMHNAPIAYVELRQREPLIRPAGNLAVARAIATKQAVQIADAIGDSSSRADPVRSSFVAATGARTFIVVPMLKENEVIGAINVYRTEVQPFTDKQIALLTNFAAQAVIAIENTRLLDELRQRTADLSESLEQQTATSEVLRVISSSPGELEPVFNAMLASATRICEARFGVLYRFDGNRLHMAASVGIPAELDKFQKQRGPFQPRPGTQIAHVVHTRQVRHTPDALGDADTATSAPVRFGGARSMIAVPMLKDDEVVGVISIYRQEVRPFTDKQIELVKNFAAQAVIAIENTRLLNELRQSLEQQTATSAVLSVISRSPGDLQPVFGSMLENATHLLEANFGVLALHERGAFRTCAMHNAPPAFIELRTREPLFRVSPLSVVGRVAAAKEVIHVADYTLEPTYMQREPAAVALADLGGARTVLAVPMLKERELIGVILIYRQEVRPFTDKQIELVKNFASQAVIAIENARLLNELRQRTDDLSKSLEDLRTAQDRLVQTQKLASLGQLTAGIAHEIKNPLNFVNNFSGLSVELLDELQEAVESGTFDDKRRSEIAELTDTLRGNLDKIAQHGKRADSIVKNMLLHSREGSGERRLINVNALVEESLNLAYHGARAEKQGFTITLERSFDPEAGEADVFPQEITRVLLNLIANGFYAATRRQGQAGDNGYEPILTASTRTLGDRVEIRIRDNGTGIPPEVQEKMFNPFFTTKPAGEGTGLGLSISHDIIVKQHAGSIEVDTEQGEFTEFRIILPRTAA